MTHLKLVLLLALALLAAPQSPGADLILHDGVIWTVDAQNPTAQAGAIKDGKFIAVGADKSVLAKNLLKIEPKEYLTTNGIYTIVDGKIVYEVAN